VFAQCVCASLHRRDRVNNAKDTMALNIASTVLHHLENILGSFRACCVRDRCARA
jgi:hypothetical protein